ncbi:hypothetical protein B0T22DRAFT_184431 [Podospora appendiculata]|uniref:Uncharacterized protein n=1 Tax=Podospora appendiculata TaxID=314037 RepID=A0AAE1CDR5_9PEZI|nr:hypothetical protein B0T22DRAFT_184431 [Podospora appendiculata]
MARRLQNRLALAQFKTKHGLEDLTLDIIEPKFEKEIRLSRYPDGDILSDSSSSASDLPYPSRALMSSPLKPPFFSDAIGSSNGSTGHRKRTYMASFDNVDSSPSKRFRNSPTAHRSFTTGHVSWKDHHQLAQSSPLKPRRQQHFTTSTGPNVSFFAGSAQLNEASFASPNYAALSDDDDDLLPAHSFSVNHSRGPSPPRTPPMRSRTTLNKRSHKPANGTGAAANAGKTGEEGADLLLYLAASPSPANKSKSNSSSNGNHSNTNNRMDPPSTPPPKNKMALPSSMMTTPGGGNPFPNTPGLAFDFSDFVHMTPSPAQKPWKTPVALTGGRTPRSAAKRRLTFDDYP